MNNYLDKICQLICVICFFAYLGGCADQSAPVEAKVVRKKITAKRPTVTPSKTAPAKVAKVPTVPSPKSDIARGAPHQPAPTVGKSVSDSQAVPTSGMKPKAAVAKTPVTKKPKQPALKVDSGQSSKPATKAAGPTKTETARPAAQPTTSDLTVVSKTSPLPSVQKADAKKSQGGTNAPPPVYNPTGKTDPFKPLFRDKPALPSAGKKKKKRIPRTPLERVALSQLKLTAIIMAPSGNRALVQESSGKGYVIKKGTYIGLNSGKVENITKDKVIIAEEVEDSVGKIRVQTKQLVLPKPAGDR